MINIRQVQSGNSWLGAQKKSVDYSQLSASESLVWRKRRCMGYLKVWMIYSC